MEQKPHKIDFQLVFGLLRRPVWAAFRIPLCSSENCWKTIFLTFFSIGGASRRAGVEKTLATLRPELPRASIYGVLSRQNVTFRLFALAMRTLEKTSPELPVGPPNAFIFNENLQKGGLEKLRKIHDNCIGQKPEKLPKSTSKWRSKSRSNSGLETKLSQRGPRPRKDTNK